MLNEGSTLHEQRSHRFTQANNMSFGDAGLKTLYFCTWISLHSIRLLVPGVRVPAVPVSRRAR